jgi:hypothetical protein
MRTDVREPEEPRERLLAEIHALGDVPAPTHQGAIDRERAVARWLEQRDLKMPVERPSRHKRVSAWAAGIAAALVIGAGVQHLRAPGATPASARAIGVAEPATSESPRAVPPAVPMVAARPPLSPPALPPASPLLPAFPREPATAYKDGSRPPILAAEALAAPARVATAAPVGDREPPSTLEAAALASGPAERTIPEAAGRSPNSSDASLPPQLAATQTCDGCESPSAPILDPAPIEGVAQTPRSLPLASPIVIAPVSVEQLRDLQRSGANDIATSLPSLTFDALDPCVEPRGMSAAVEPEDPKRQTYGARECREP